MKLMKKNVDLVGRKMIEEIYMTYESMNHYNSFIKQVNQACYMYMYVYFLIFILLSETLNLDKLFEPTTYMT